MTTKFPQVHVQLSGGDSNVFAVIGAVTRALKSEGLRQEAKEFSDAAFACGSYDEVLQLCMKTVHVL